MMLTRQEHHFHALRRYAHHKIKEVPLKSTNACIHIWNGFIPDLRGDMARQS
jgi:hypothetical protein